VFADYFSLSHQQHEKVIYSPSSLEDPFYPQVVDLKSQKSTSILEE
jgi:hypothetical protein